MSCFLPKTGTLVPMSPWPAGVAAGAKLGPLRSLSNSSASRAGNMDEPEPVHITNVIVGMTMLVRVGSMCPAEANPARGEPVSLHLCQALPCRPH